MEPIRPDIVLIVIDTQRWDALGLFDETYRYSPRLDARMRGWIRFPRCFSSAPWTLPACTSILTGLDAGTHGRYFHERPFEGDTIAHLLGPEYERVGIANNRNLEEESGLGRGFDAYACDEDHDAAYAAGARHFDPAGSKKRPRFLFFHTNIPHDYYRGFTAPYYRDCFPGRDDWFELERRIGSWSGVPARRRSIVRSIYDGCVHQLDTRLAALVDRVDLETTVVCVVADHGEGFDFERGRVHHGGRVHDDLIRVPLLLHVPPSLPAAQRRTLEEARHQAVSTSDIVPTLLDLAGARLPPGLDGRSLLRNPATAGTRYLVSEDRRYLYGPSRNRLNRNRQGQNTSRWSRPRNRLLQSLVVGDFNTKAFVAYPHKLIVSSYALHHARWRPLMAPVVNRLAYPYAWSRWHGDALAALELYDLELDPHETHNLLTGAAAETAQGLLRERFADADSLAFRLDGGERAVLEFAQ